MDDAPCDIRYLPIAAPFSRRALQWRQWLGRIFLMVKPICVFLFAGIATPEKLELLYSNNI
jgi:hypothetical protein